MFVETTLSSKFESHSLRHIYNNLPLLRSSPRSIQCKSGNLVVGFLHRADRLAIAILHGHSDTGMAHEVFNEALEELRSAVRLSRRQPFYLSALGDGYVAAGQAHEASTILTEIIQSPDHKYVPAFDVAALSARLGHEDQALPMVGEGQRGGRLPKHCRSSSRILLLTASGPTRVIQRYFEIPVFPSDKAVVELAIIW